jgi:hypothetical protein
MIHFLQMIINVGWFIFTHWYFMLNDSFDYCEILSHYDSFLLSVILLKIDSFSWVEILVPQIHFRGLKFCGWWFIFAFWNFKGYDSFAHTEILLILIHFRRLIIHVGWFILSIWNFAFDDSFSWVEILSRLIHLNFLKF